MQNLNGKLLELIDGYIKNLKQEFLGASEDVLSEVIEEFKIDIAALSWKLSQKWCKWSYECPLLFPNNTRLFYRKGNTEIILQENSPQMRLMKFSAELNLKKKSTIDSCEEHESNYFSLALPYLNFVFIFKDGFFDRLICTFCNLPLKTLDEQPLVPFLPNISPNLEVCLGNFDENKLIKDQYSQQVAYVLNHFWQTSYSSDLSANFWDYKDHFTKIEDPRFESFESWQSSSEQNSLFVVEDVEWMPSPYESYGALISELFEDVQNASFEQNLYSELIEEFTTKLEQSLDNHIKAIMKD